MSTRNTPCPSHPWTKPNVNKLIPFPRVERLTSAGTKHIPGAEGAGRLLLRKTLRLRVRATMGNGSPQARLQRMEKRSKDRAERQLPLGSSQHGAPRPTPFMPTFPPKFGLGLHSGVIAEVHGCSFCVGPV